MNFKEYLSENDKLKALKSFNQIEYMPSGSFRFETVPPIENEHFATYKIPKDRKIQTGQLADIFQHDGSWTQRHKGPSSIPAYKSYSWDFKIGGTPALLVFLVDDQERGKTIVVNAHRDAADILNTILNKLGLKQISENNKLEGLKSFVSDERRRDIFQKYDRLRYSSRPPNSYDLYNIFKDAVDLTLTIYGRKRFAYAQYQEVEADQYSVTGEILEVKPNGIHMLWSEIIPRQAFRKAEEGDEIFIPFKDMIADFNYERKEQEADREYFMRNEF
jgi:hypothetical protein